MWVWPSTKPGATTSPSASMTSRARSRMRPIVSIRPWLRPTPRAATVAATVAATAGVAAPRVVTTVLTRAFIISITEAACSSASRPSSRFRTGGMTRRTTTLRPSSSPSHPSTSSSSPGGSRTRTTARARALTTRTRRAVLSPGSRFPPLLADRRSPGRFYIDRQSSSSVRPLAPVVDRDGVLVGAAHDAPVPVGLAPDHHDVDVLAPEHRDQLIRRRAEVRRPRLLAERRPRVDVILDELIVPVLAGRQSRGVVEPVDERVLLREPATLDELARGDRIEQERRRSVGIHPAEQVPDVLAPVLLAQPEGEGGGPASGEDAHGARVGPEPVLDVERLPRAPLLVLGERHAVVRVVVALVAHVGDAGHRAALQVLGEQAVGAADGRVGVVVRPHGPRARVHRDLAADRSVDHRHRRHRARAASARRHARGRWREDHR